MEVKLENPVEVLDILEVLICYCAEGKEVRESRLAVLLVLQKTVLHEGGTVDFLLLGEHCDRVLREFVEDWKMTWLGGY